MSTPARYDAATAECLLFTEKAGLLSGVAHDLKLLVTRLEVQLEGLSARARFDAASVRVVCARQGGRDAPGVLSAKDRAEIERTVAQSILDAPHFPAIEFRSTAVARGDGGYRVDGVLTLRGREGPLSLIGRRQGDLAILDGSLHQPAFGIVPYSAMMGALRIKPDVALRMVLPWPKDADS